MLEAKINSGDFAGAIVAGKKAVAANPKSKTAWNNLGRAYLGAMHPAEAEAALRKQIEVNPYDAYAYNNLGLALSRLGRFDEAAKAFCQAD